MLFICAVRIVNVLDSQTQSNAPMVFSLLMNASLIISISLYLANLQTEDNRYAQNINQKLIDRIYAGSNYFQSSALLLEIAIHPIEPPVVWTMFKLDRALLFRFSFVLTTIVIICCYFKGNEGLSSKDASAEVEVGSLF